MAFDGKEVGMRLREVKWLNKISSRVYSKKYKRPLKNYIRDLLLLKNFFCLGITVIV